MQNFLIYRSASTFQLAGFFFIALFAFPPRDYEPGDTVATCAPLKQTCTFQRKLPAGLWLRLAA